MLPLLDLVANASASSLPRLPGAQRESTLAEAGCTPTQGRAEVGPALAEVVQPLADGVRVGVRVLGQPGERLESKGDVGNGMWEKTGCTGGSCLCSELSQEVHFLLFCVVL